MEFQVVPWQIVIWLFAEGRSVHVEVAGSTSELRAPLLRLAGHLIPLRGAPIPLDHLRVELAIRVRWRDTRRHGSVRRGIQKIAVFEGRRAEEAAALVSKDASRACQAE